MLRITPAGLISFILKSYGGAASDCCINKFSGIVEKLHFGDNLMTDKRFKISDLLVSKESRFIIPPFWEITTGFPRKIVKQLLKIAKARIHVERAITRVKDFSISNGEFPITLKDQLDYIFSIYCALINLGPVLVPL